MTEKDKDTKENTSQHEPEVDGGDFSATNNKTIPHLLSKGNNEKRDYLGDLLKNQVKINLDLPQGDRNR